MTPVPEKVLLASPRGYCAGVDRAVESVEHALDVFGPPVYVRKEIVHNKHVVETLKARGAIFVDSAAEVPEGETVVFRAHGVSPAHHAQAANPRIIVEIQSASMETDPGKGMHLRGQRDAASFHVKHPPKTYADQDSQAAPPRLREGGT